MTRINLVDPYILTDQHLVAEYKEILQLCGSLKKSLASKTGYNSNRVPVEFTLNKGHVYFFYNKGLYLYKRFNKIKDEMVLRGYRTDKDFPINLWPSDLYNDWAPNDKDFQIIKERIISKFPLKENWYKHYGKTLSTDQLIKMYN